MYHHNLQTYAKLSRAAYCPFAGSQFGLSVRSAAEEFRVTKTWEFHDGVEAFSVIDVRECYPDYFKNPDPAPPDTPLSREKLSSPILYVGIRGTEICKRDDRFRDYFAIRQNRGPGRYAHSGFADGADQLAGSVFAEAIKRKARKIVLTGHSAGGAIAACCLPTLRKEGMRVSLISFGCPMIGNLGYCDYLDSLGLEEAVRVVNCADFVPRLPFQKLHGWVSGRPWHHHPGDLYYFDLDETLVLNPSKSFRASQIFWAALKNRKAWLLHHSSSDYIRLSAGITI